ncbi:hypothetical protein ACIQAL_09645 [Pseudomonas sp. NPDC088368]|uniref:hypothetical protein n=1 Tax=Pseudomonas sp. NPDC088368 TaxID=3364453 RepID=UPI0038095D0F
MKSRFQRMAHTTVFVGALLAAMASFAAGTDDQPLPQLNPHGQLVSENSLQSLLDTATQIVNIILGDIPISVIIG